jgi:ankyrin repeat protein
MNHFVSTGRVLSFAANIMLLASASSAFAEHTTPTQASSSPAVGAAPARPATSPSLVPKAEPLAPRAFTLEDRYLDAARRGDLAVLRLCLEKGADLRAKDGFGRSALLLAARDARSLEMVRLLQGRGLVPDEADNSGRAALAWAAGNGDLAMVSYLVEQGAQVDRKDWQGQSPLYNAVLGGSRETVLRLIAAAADVNVRDNFGDTPLIGACDKGFDEIARLLVEKGADPALRDQEGRSARERAAESAAYCRGLP